MKQFLTNLVTAHTGVSSKRACGILGWIIGLIILIYCTINQMEAPQMIDTMFYCCMGLLGIDSVTGVFKKYKDG